MDLKKIDVRTLGGYIASILLFAAAAAVIMTGAVRFSRQADREGAETLRNGIRRASVQCYAIEGRYPPSVDYLKENYGIQIDEKRYHVFYEGFASNVMPEITVVEANSSE